MRIILSLLLSILTAFEGALTFYLLTVIIADPLTELGGMSNFEGGRGYFVGLIIGPVGGLVGLIAGAICGWRIGSRPATPGSVLFVVASAFFTVGLAWYVWTTG